MKVDKLNLQTMFAKQIWYEVPRFQRQYVWDEDEQWEPLWADVQNTAERSLAMRNGGTVGMQQQTHFLGAIVLQQTQNMTGQLESRLVVDGQQRLTTLQLLVDAIQEVYEQQGLQTAAERLADMVLNYERYRGGDPDRAFKVWPTAADQEAFRHAMSNELPSDEFKDSNIVRAHEFFKTQIAHWLMKDPEERETRADALERTVNNLLELVVIDLEMGDDPHVIFETLNARGTPLLESDLVKNMVMHEAVSTGIALDSEAGKNLWKFDDGWWSQDVQQGRLVRPRIDVFLNYWLVMRSQNEVAAKEVFSTFRRNYPDWCPSGSIVGLADEIRAAAEHYRTLETKNRAEMEQFLYRREIMQAGVLTPVLMWLLTAETPQQQLDKALRALESFLVRRMILRMSTNGYNLLFIGMLEPLAEAGAQRAGDTVSAYLKDQKAPARLWPNDHALREAFTSWPLYKLLTRGRLRLVLEGIESDLRTRMAESQTVERTLTIEHIMPQQWRENWRLPSYIEDVDKANIDRDNLIHSMGNLTLVNGRLNSSLSNASWEDKRAALDKHGMFFLNKNLVSEAPDVWNETTIEQRALALCESAARVWPSSEMF